MFKAKFGSHCKCLDLCFHNKLPLAEREVGVIHIGSICKICDHLCSDIQKQKKSPFSRFYPWIRLYVHNFPI